MAIASYQKSSPAWWLEMAQRRLGEWIELKFSQVDLPDLPEVAPFDWPDWLRQLLGWWLDNWAESLLLVLGLLLAWGLWRWGLWQWGLARWRRWQRGAEAGARSPQDDFAHHSAETWLQQAQQHQQQGEYNSACRALYMALLHRLDHHQLAPYSSSRTDQEYLRLIQGLSPRQAYRLLLETHERLCFSTDQASAELFQQCRQAFEQIEQLQRTATSAPPTAPPPAVEG